MLFTFLTYCVVIIFILCARAQQLHDAAAVFIVQAPLDAWIAQQEKTSLEMMLKNINPPGTRRGFYAASLSTSWPDYYYTWTRDAALVARVLASVLPDTDTNVLKDYVDFQVHVQKETLSTVCQCLGEPKFNPDGTGFMGSWGRPQNDGPAERIIAFIAIARRFSDETAYIDTVLQPAIQTDMDYLRQQWQTPCFDLWEEVDGVHFYTLMVIRRALLDAMEFLNKTDQPTVQVVEAIETQLETLFWSSSENYIKATHHARNGVTKQSGLDVSTLLAANYLAYRDDGFFTPGSDKILATAVALENAFQSLYPLNQNNADTHLGTSIGRYPEDIYDGYGTSIGNPWFLATAAYTELYYLAIKEWKRHGLVITAVNKPFFDRIMSSSCSSQWDVLCQQSDDGYNYYLAPDSQPLQDIIDKTKEAADKFLATIQFHQHRNGSMSEQFDRYTGYMRGARDLTWSHAAFISAIQARSSKAVS
ncbi:Six-hairpin glycosidase-like protein [Mycotypha africana]|uniref:Six-hairpin glycosidase-like protein n=1 Tax=Mycotypha africana TaxID=64632 RepID=UPI0023019371|nr:Six-hairpin glycosidase-like protein [Mycotypha africana]KAI8979364.1 Six-hairpin glycosidase-like protein [Mycotypha africana]